MGECLDDAAHEARVAQVDEPTKAYGGVRSGPPPLRVRLEQRHLHGVRRPRPVLSAQPERTPRLLLAVDSNASDLRVIDVIAARHTQNLALLHIHDKIVLHGGSVVLDVALVAGKVDAVKASMDSGRMCRTN